MTVDRVVLHDATYTTLLLTHVEAKQECDALLLGAWQCSVVELRTQDLTLGQGVILTVFFDLDLQHNDLQER